MLVSEDGMKKLLVVTSVLEGVTGVLVLLLPALLIRLLFNCEINSSGVLVGRFAGVCLISLAVACWPDRNIPRALFGMLTYNVLVAIYFIVVGVTGTAGILLWPVAVTHAGLTVLLVRVWKKEREGLAVFR
jgi:hypothetical protein